MVIQTPGVYKIEVNVQTAQPSQFSIYVNGALVPGTTFGSFSGTSITHGASFVSLQAGDVVTLVNHASLDAVQLQVNPGGTEAAVNASMTLQREND
ncbi:hypothetical protein KDAU_12440 [Dictyobacter aurantiacus]|uniref:BclA C-terminal domain-containing protein n=1 Tax=Dictyobacter aurantiacus TaxID=1936993 RepID=A0A401ZAN7_9CHLR|nr:hypothetical protein KDAU_12440 [Dictyobacter aurantiacus]